ncbi:MAG: adenine-specific methyltransferase EcoRI family protein [bacterium]
MAQKNLHNAKKTKNDEFYTQYQDIQKEIQAYIDYDPDVFRGKIVYCNCDDPFESNFFKYFANKFKEFGLKKLITTSYVGSPIVQTQIQIPGFEEMGKNKTLSNRKNKKAFKIEINEVSDLNKDGITNLNDVKWLLEHDNNAYSLLLGDDKYAAGDFRSNECVELLKQADIVVTNPPFSLFREYLKQLIEYKKKFLIIGSMNAITYKEVFPLIKDNKIWLGNNHKVNGGAMFYEIPEDIANLEQVREIRTDENGKKVYITRVQGVRWFTNLDHGRLHEFLPLMKLSDVIKFGTKRSFDNYDNFNAIEVPFVKHIPGDFKGIMGVPISFLDKYSPEQFDIIGLGIANLGLSIGVKPYKPEHKKYRKEVQKRGTVNGDLYMIKDETVVVPFARILIKHKKGIA